MECLIPCTIVIKDLQGQAKKLTSTGPSLNNLFAEEAIRLNRSDQSSCLKALYSFIRQQMDRAKSSEAASRYGNSKARLVISLGGLVVGGIIKMTSEDKRAQAFSDHLLKNLGGKQRPFGMVFVCIGPKGLPDDVEVVSVSRLARESNREESDVINELRGRGCLLFSEQAFSLLIDNLVKGIQEGRLLLPISAEKLAEINTSSFFTLEATKSEWVRYSEPR